MTKIGCSFNPRSRLRQVAPKAAGLSIEHTIPTWAPYRIEHYLHEAFCHRRVKKEWFRLAGEDVALLKSIPFANSTGDLPTAIVALWHMNKAAGFVRTIGDDTATTPDEVDAGRRIPVPTEDPAYARAILSQQEMADFSRLALGANLSVTSFFRVLVVSAATSPQPDLWDKVAASLLASADPGRKMPGRPKKGAA